MEYYVKQYKALEYELDELSLFWLDTENLYFWLIERYPYLQIALEDVQLIMKYYNQNGSVMGVCGQKLIRGDFVFYAYSKVTEITVDELIEEVYLWNYELIEETEQLLAQIKKDKDFCMDKPFHKELYEKKQEYYNELLCEEIRLDELYEMTEIAKQNQEISNFLQEFNHSSDGGDAEWEKED